jgi:AraC-like DNA-binding protein
MSRTQANFASLTVGRELRPGAGILPRHRHRRGYVTLVLAGGYEESGDYGRCTTRAGDVVFHKPFGAHCNRILAGGADTLNFELDGWSEHPMDLGHIDDPDLIVRTAERDPVEARELLCAMSIPTGYVHCDWPDQLANDIRVTPGLRLGEWAESHGLALETLSRGFRRVYQVSPATFRAQVRATLAWQRVMRTHEPLSAIACEQGFADQAHMTRAIGMITGYTPSHWRANGANQVK